MGGYYGSASDGGCGVGTSTTHFSSQNKFGRGRKYWGSHTYHHERTISPMGLLRNSYYPVGTYDGYLFGFSVGDGKIGMGPSTNQLTSHKVGCCIDGIVIIHP